MKPIILAVLSALTVAVGVAMACLPAGVVVLGLEGLAAAYAIMYLKAKR